jgi:hypothetical protein
MKPTTRADSIPCQCGRFGLAVVTRLLRRLCLQQPLSTRRRHWYVWMCVWLVLTLPDANTCTHLSERPPTDDGERLKVTDALALPP